MAIAILMEKIQSNIQFLIHESESRIVFYLKIMSLYPNIQYNILGNGRNFRKYKELSLSHVKNCKFIPDKIVIPEIKETPKPQLDMFSAVFNALSTDTKIKLIKEQYGVYVDHQGLINMKTELLNKEL